ncbi:MAG: tyrosine-type recombinase/integrase, partial [Acidimicrobiales bacterium]
TEPDGTRQRVSFSAPTRHEAQAKRDDFRDRIQQGLVTTKAPTPPAAVHETTVAQFLAEWLAQREHEIEPSTYRCYEILVRKHLVPAIGKVPLAKLTRAQIRNMQAEMRSKKKSTRTIRGAFVVLRCALNWAVLEEMLASNPSAGLKVPKHEGNKANPMMRYQVAAFLKAAEQSPLNALYQVAVTTGIRQGELLGLHWRDLDFENGTLAVRGQAKEHKGHITIANYTKTRADRKVELPRMVIDALLRHRESVPPKRRAANALIFTDSLGGPLRKSNLLRRSFWLILERAKLKEPEKPSPFRFHDLRHTCAVMLLQGGEQAKAVQELLGHSSIKVTLDVYGAWCPTIHRACARTMDNLFA